MGNSVWGAFNNFVILCVNIWYSINILTQGVRPGQRINADLNGAYNIIRKHVPGFSSRVDSMVRDAVVYPVHTLQGFHKH